MLIALGALALVAALSAAALSAATGPSARAAAAVERAKAVRAAEAAVHRLAAAMARDELRALAVMDGAVVSTSFLDAKIDFAAQDAAGLVHLGLASEETLARLFAVFDAPSAGRIAAVLVEARREEGRRSGFASAEEALQALPEALRAEAEPAFAHAAVHGRGATVDPWVATAPALAAAGDVSLEAAQAFVAARTLEGRRAALPAELDQTALAVSDGRVARLTVRAETEGGGRAETVVFLRATRSPRAPVAVLSWR